jgi:hypothetical protein
MSQKRSGLSLKHRVRNESVVATHAENHERDRNERNGVPSSQVTLVLSRSCSEIGRPCTPGRELVSAAPPGLAPQRGLGGAGNPGRLLALLAGY